MFLRKPLKPLRGLILRVLVYARYSTEEQDASSIPDQVAYCRRFLESQGVKKAEIEVVSDAEMSGELVYRPGINEVRQGVGDRRWDLILCEDSSRLYRTVAPCLTLVGGAVDNAIRVICINDDVDTTDELWQERLVDALSPHARSNRFTSQRIKRKHEALWSMGAAIGLLKPGYCRRASIPARMGEPAKGPFYDEKEAQWEQIIYEAYERINDGELPWQVGVWLTTNGFPKCANFKLPAYSATNVINFIRRPDYRGEQFYRNTVSKKHFGTGKRKPSDNSEEGGPLKRLMEHLRVVPDWLWYGANAAIDGRASPVERKKGLDHPQAGKSRDSRGPLSNNFSCGICGAKMHQDGRGEGGYRCSRARSRLNPCWNRASALREFTHTSISRAISRSLIGSRDNLKVLIGQVATQFRSDKCIHKMLAKANAEEQCIMLAIDQLGDCVARLKSTGNAAADQLEAKLDARGTELHHCRLEIQRLEALQNDEDQAQISPEQIAKALDDAATQLFDFGPEASALIRRLAPKILAVPYQQFATNKVVLRAQFNLQLGQLLPTQLQALLDGDESAADTSQLLTIPMSVDLFDMSHSPKYGLQAFALKQQEPNVRLVDIGEKLGISKRSAHLALKYGSAMNEAGITDPFRELTESPANASRWRPEGRNRLAG